MPPSVTSPPLSPIPITFRLPPEQAAWLDTRANGLCSRSAVIRQLIDDAMRRETDEQR